ncbi:hypothetical protein L5D93_20000 [Paenibacillus thiaminolyticus]|nr:hypothetical protein [Paenibacillus thiaminolyticus]
MVPAAFLQKCRNFSKVRGNVEKLLRICIIFFQLRRIQAKKSEIPALLQAPLFQRADHVEFLYFCIIPGR